MDLINSQIGRSTYNSSTLGHINSKVLTDFFVNLGTNTKKNIKHPGGNVFATVRQPLQTSLFFAPTSSNEIISIVSKLTPKLSTSFDNISVKLLKQIILQIDNPFSKIFNKSLSHGIFPDLLKIARIILIFKSGDSSDPKNYRPISLLPSFSKILEQIIYNRLISFFNKHDILHSSQHGFRTNHSTNSAIAEALDCVTLALNKKLLSLALFIDVSKAFDSLDHQLLFAKLNIYGVRGTALDLMKSYFSNRFQYTIVNNDSFNFCKIPTGVPQGSIIGPLMYVIYGNDVFNVTDFMKCVLYADDTVIIISARTKDELLALATHYLTL